MEIFERGLVRYDVLCEISICEFMFTESENFKELIESLERGEVVVYPTETLWGLGVVPTSDRAVRGLLELKGRSASMGLPLVCSGSEVFFSLAVFLGDTHKRMVRELVEKHWPGPLTLVVDVVDEWREKLSPLVFSKEGSLAIRWSSSAVASFLAESVSGFLVSTSANRHGQKPISTYLEAKEEFSELSVFCPTKDKAMELCGLGSTIVDVRTENCQVLREGICKL